MHWRNRKRSIFVILVFLIFLFFWKKTYPDHDNRLQTMFVDDINMTVIIVGADNMQGVQRRKHSLENENCNFPKLEQTGMEMMKFIEKAKPLDCEIKAKQKNWVFINEKGMLTMEANRKTAECQISYFKRKTDFENIKMSPVQLLTEKKMDGDFAEVYCKDGNETWLGLLTSVARNEDIVDKQKEKAGTRKSGEDRLDVVMFGFDSMSQQHFRRKMPASIEQLNKMGAVIFNGYNIVGDGTPQAFIPILTGQTELELPNTRKRYADSKTVDVYPFVWNNFSDAGYITLYGEDYYGIGVYTYRLKGFDKQPTDHYTRTFYKEQEDTKKYGDRMCLGSDPLHKAWFRYGHEFLREYKDMDRFLLLHQGVLSHDHINLIEVEDQDFADSLESMEDEGLLENAVLIVMADHGHRFTSIRNTHQGQLEERLPMFSVRLPPKFRNTELGKRIQANLEANKDRLTTPFDVYSTYLDILNLPKDVDTVQDKNKRSLSMFRPIPQDRSCDKAGVEPHWCTCLNWQNGSATSEDQEETSKLAKGLVSAIDNQLKDVRHLCANVSLKSVISSQKLIPNEGLLKYNNVKDADGFVPKFEGTVRAAFAHYKLKVLTSPNDAEYEATVYFDGRKNELEVDLTALSHVNAYGDDPHCIISQQFALAHFCVCHDRVRT